MFNRKYIFKQWVLHGFTVLHCHLSFPGTYLFGLFLGKLGVLCPFRALWVYCWFHRDGNPGFWPGQGVHHPPHHPTAPPHPLGTHRTVTAGGTRSGDLAEGAGKAVPEVFR